MSINLDDDESKWKEFITENEMTWSQCHSENGFKGPVAQLFGIHEIPQTFTIDADGVLQDQQIGDASIDGKLKKLVKRAREVQEQAKPITPPGEAQHRSQRTKNTEAICLCSPDTETCHL